MKLFAVPQIYWDDSGYKKEINVFSVKAENAEKALSLVKESREPHQSGYYDYEDVEEIKIDDDDVQLIYRSYDN